MSESPQPAPLDRSRLSVVLKTEAQRLGFDLAGIAPAVSPGGFGALTDWLQKGFAGRMEYIGRREAAYAHPDSVLPRVRSVLMLGMNYRNEPPQPAGPNQGRVSRYAWGDADYHHVLRGKLKQLAGLLREHRPGCRTRGVVDTAPLLERDFARLAGLGWFGKNTMLINKRAGSWLFLAAVLSDVELDYDQPHETSHCGTCRRCLDACPTDAFPEPYVLDARRCISYLTIELREPIPAEFREPMGDWLFGCDICQDVCPWNGKAPMSEVREFRPVPDLSPADAVALLGMSEEAFHARFDSTALERPGRGGMLRNAAIVLGNHGDGRAIPVLSKALNDAEPIIRGAAAWALGRIGGTAAVDGLRARCEIETNPDVSQELRAAINNAARTVGESEDLATPRAG